MNDEELTNMIIKELGKHHDRQEVVRKVCENSTLGWVDAEKFINEVEAQNRRKIAVRQGPLLIFLSIGSLVIGLGLLVYNMEVLAAIFSSDLMQQILSLRSGYYRLAGLVTGLAMAVGGFYGVWTTLASFFPSE
ncbi:MAG TPA: hypothetical protein VK909_16225 [Anaerolineales bacterium]|nr:hypothetical protein [Anaerolineales bacterium]